MKNDKNHSPLKSLQTVAADLLHGLRRYAVVVFVLLLAAAYGIVLFRAYTFANAQPDDAAVSAQVKASAAPHIDPTAIQQLQALQDNSVNVQSLFNQTRSNPFQE